MKGALRHQRPFVSPPHNQHNQHPSNSSSIPPTVDNSSSENTITSTTNNNATTNKSNRLRELRKRKTKEDRQEGKIVIHMVPDETTEDEISDLLRGWIFDLDIKNVFLLRPQKPGKTGVLSLKAFVEFSSNEWADRIINYYEQHKTNLGTPGYIFTNSKDTTATLLLEYCLKVKDRSYNKNSNNQNSNNSNRNNNNNNNSNNKDNVNHTKRNGARGPSDSAKPSDALETVVNEIANIKHERALYLTNIQKMEAELKKRMPDLFVSEFEMNALRREDYELNEKIKEQCIALENGRQMLKGVQEDLEQLNKLYNEDLEDELAQLKLNARPAQSH